MKLAAQLRQRALLAQLKRRTRQRNAQITPIPFPSLAVQYYTRGIRAVLGIVREGFDEQVRPWLPGLIEQYNALRSDGGLMRLDAGTPKRIAIVGPPRSGKTTEALRLGRELGIDVHHADDLIPLGWSEASAELARRMTAAQSGVFEGVAVVRALRKMLGSAGAPVDRVIVLSAPRLELNEGQKRMARGHETVWLEIAPELSRRGVEFVFDLSVEASVHRADATGKTIDELFQRLAEHFARRVDPSVVKVLVEQSAERVSNTNRGAVVRQMKQLANIDVFVSDQGLAEHVEAFVSENVRAVQGLTDSAMRRLHGVVLQGARQGLRHEELAKQIRGELQVSERRAANLARDQLAALNGELTELRQTQLGVRRYRWITSRDERVRKSHRALDGTIQSWAKPPVVNPATGERGHPGRPRRCRCTATAVIDDVLQEAGLLGDAKKLSKVGPGLPKPTPANLPKEHTVEFHEAALRGRYKGAARTVAWGRAMAARGRDIPLGEFHKEVAGLRKLGVEVQDVREFSYVKDLIASSKAKTVGALLDAMASDPQLSALRENVRREVQISSRLIAHRRALAGQVGPIRIPAGNIQRWSGSKLTRKQTESTVARARQIYENLSHKSIRQPVDYSFVADSQRRAFQRAGANGRGYINLGVGGSKERAVQDALHEWGHAIEALNQSRLEAAVEYLEARVQGEQLVRMNSLRNLEHAGYADHEVTQPDELFHPYMGKRYEAAPGAQSHRGRGATEVTSMAVQHLHRVSELEERVFRIDPDSFDFVLGQLAGQ